MDEVLVAERVLKGTGTMIDVGAHAGGSAEPFLARGWTVHAFEPDPANREELQRLSAKFKRLRIDARAVSDTNQIDLPFFTSSVSTGISGLSSFHRSHQQTARVSTVTLERYCADHRIGTVEFLKSDTEGFDLFVLKGFPWHTLLPNIVICEFEDRKTVPLGYTWKEIADLLVSKGYRLIISEWHPIVEYGTSHRWKRFIVYPCELVEDRAWGNIIAMRDAGTFDRMMKACRRAREEVVNQDRAALEV